MTEEIIKECKFYMSFSEDCNEILDDNGNEVYKCSSRQDCYYKQLIRLKQQHNDGTEEIAKLGLDVAILEQENKELKEKVKELDKMTGIFSARLCNKYRSALEEIKHILEIHKYELEECLHNDIYGMIQNKINEVIDEN